MAFYRFSIPALFTYSRSNQRLCLRHSTGFQQRETNLKQQLSHCRVSGQRWSGQRGGEQELRGKKQSLNYFDLWCDVNHRVVNPFLANCYQHERFLPYSSSVFNINFQGQQREIALVPWVSLVASLIKTALTALSHFADWGNRHTHIHKHIHTPSLIHSCVQ